MNMDWARFVNNLQVDLTSYCNARCGACVRNVDGDEVKQELVLEHFDMEVWTRLCSEDTRGWYIVELSLNGNWGDPMMHPKMVEMLEIYCAYHPETALYIHTNGAMRTEKFWNSLGKICRKFTNHAVKFAVDGMSDTHSLYRRKTEWEKIIRNSKAFIAGGGRACYTMTLFEHNKHQIKEVENLAYENGCVQFALRHSHGDHMNIVTVDGNYEINGHYDIEEYQINWDDRQDRPISDLRDRNVFLETTDEIMDNQKDHKCPWYSDRKIQIDPWGTVWPCCHLSLYGVPIENHDLNLMVDDSFFEAREENDLKKYSLSEVLNNEWFTTDLKRAVKNASWKQCRDICGICK